MKMKRVLLGIMAAALAVAPVFAQDAEKPKKKMKNDQTGKQKKESI